MLQKINIQLIEKIKKPIKDNHILNEIMNVLIIILFPVILIVGIIIMIFIGVFTFLQKIFYKSETKLKLETESIQVEQWNLFINLSGINIYEKYVGEIRFGPAYLNLKSEPKIEFLKNKLFGDWFYTCSNGILLQQWNSTKKPNTNLIFMEIDNHEMRVLEKNIPSVSWEVLETKDKTLELICDTGKEVLTYKIEIKNVG